MHIYIIHKKIALLLFGQPYQGTLVQSFKTAFVAHYCIFKLNLYFTFNCQKKLNNDIQNTEPHSGNAMFFKKKTFLCFNFREKTIYKQLVSFTIFLPRSIFLVGGNNMNNTQMALLGDWEELTKPVLPAVVKRHLVGGGKKDIWLTGSIRRYKFVDIEKI